MITSYMKGILQKSILLCKMVSLRINQRMNELRITELIALTKTDYVLHCSFVAIIRRTLILII
jgi:hypothetical protein